MSVNTPVKLTIKDYKSELHNDWCAGCGDFGILTSIQMALAQLQLDPDKVAVFSGIGCSGKTPHYINAYGFHTLHGRVLTVATGARLANTKQTVLALGGDGDGYGIGAGYFVGTGRRNVDFAYIVHNNNVYGLTKGQASPTLAKGKKTKSMPEQSIQDGINPVAMAIASGYTFIARAYALEPKYTAAIIARAIEHRGAALVDVLQTCPTYNDLFTKGQASPTLAKGKKTKSMPEQSIQDGINPVAMAIASGYTFIARAYALEPKYTAAIIARAIEHRGAALVDVLQTCPTYNDLYTKEWYEGADLPEKRSRLYKLEDQGFDGKVKDPTDKQEIIAKKSAAVARSYEDEPIPIGVYYEIDLPTYEDEVFRRIPDLKETPLVEQNAFERDGEALRIRRRNAVRDETRWPERLDLLGRRRGQRDARQRPVVATDESGSVSADRRCHQRTDARADGARLTGVVLDHQRALRETR